MALRTTAAGLALIKQFEGLRLKAYRCPAGVLTIGYGHTNEAGGLQFKAGTVITKATAEKLLREDIDRFEDGVERLVGKAALTPHQFDALVSLAFNIGLGAFAKSTLLKKIRAGRLDEVPAQLMRWNKVKGKPVEGLTRRRRAEAALWRSLVDEAQDGARKIEDAAMPQRVDEPAPPKSMAESTIGNGTILGGGAGTLAAGKEAADAVGEAVRSGRSLWEMVLEAGPWLLVAVVVVCAAVYVWRERRRKLVEEHV